MATDQGSLPSPGDRFYVGGRSRTLEVAVLELAVRADGEPTRYLVRTSAGTRWTLIESQVDDSDVRYVGTPLPADPLAPGF